MKAKIINILRDNNYGLIVSTIIYHNKQKRYWKK